MFIELYLVSAVSVVLKDCETLVHKFKAKIRYMKIGKKERYTNEYVLKITSVEFL